MSVNYKIKYSYDYFGLGNPIADFIYHIAQAIENFLLLSSLFHHFLTDVSKL